LNKKKLNLFILSIIILSFFSGCAKQEGTKPNILLISIDSLRRDHLSCYGYVKETTPNIDKLAAKGTIFDNAISTTCWTLPSHMSMFTGLYNMQHGVDDDGKALNPAIKTLPQYMKDAGYQTYGIFSGPYLHPVFGFSRGFDEYVDCSNSKKLAENVLEMDQFMPELGKKHVSSHKDITSEIIAQTFSTWFENKNNDKPYFAFIHMWDVHFDYIPPPPYDKLYDPHYQGTITPNFANNPRLTPNMCTRDLEHLIALYDGEITWTDYNIGEIINLLENSKTLKNTMVIITADHGEQFFEHGRLGHDDLYDETLRIPLIIYYPKGFENNKMTNHVSHVDLFPTILDVSDQDIPIYLSGESILKQVENNEDGERLLLAEYNSKQRKRLMKSVRTVDWKFLCNIKRSRFMFFDLENDEKEQHSLIPYKPPIIIPEKVKEKVFESVEYYNGINETMPYFKSMDTIIPEIDKATEEHLKALGYIN